MALVVLTVALGLGACAHTPSGSRGERARVDAALRNYSELVVAMDHDGIAALFAPDGEIEHEIGPPTRGRADIDSFLVGFSAYHVLENRISSSRTIVNGASAVQQGHYHQRVRVPSGGVVQASGTFRAEWVRSAAGDWQILRMSTESDASK